MQLVHISSFDSTALRHVRDLGFSGEMSFITRVLPDDWQRLANELRLDYLSLNGYSLTQPVVEELLDKGYAVAAWTVNDCITAERLRRAGVTSLISDRPAEISAIACDSVSQAEIELAERAAEANYQEALLKQNRSQ